MSSHMESLMRRPSKPRLLRSFLLFFFSRCVRHPDPFLTARCSGAASPDTRDTSFSRSSSAASIDRESREAITLFHVSETFARKSDGGATPCLWVGTSFGSVLLMALNVPPAGEQRLLQPVTVTPSGECQQWLRYNITTSYYSNCNTTILYLKD